MSSRKVLLIAPQPFFSTRGTPLNVRALSETMAENGYEVHLLVYPFGEEIHIPGVVIHRTMKVPGICEVPVGASWRKAILDVPLAFSALLLSLKHRFSCFHGVEEGGFVAGTLGLMFGRPYIYDMDSCMVEQLRAGKFKKLCWGILLIDRLERFFLRKATAILTVAPPLTQKSKDIAPTVPVYQIEDFPVASTATRPAPAVVEGLRQEFALQGQKIALYTGNFESYQGLELALESWKIFLQDRSAASKAKLLLVGGTPQQIDESKALCRKLEIDDSVIFTGPRPAEEMGAFQSLADIVLSPRLHGGNTPLKLYSYMASGKPIVASNITAHTNVLDNTTAYLADPSPQPFAEALAFAFSDPRAKEKAEKAESLVATYYSRENFERRIRELYEFVLPVAGGISPQPSLPANRAEAPTTLQ